MNKNGLVCLAVVFGAGLPCGVGYAGDAAEWVRVERVAERVELATFDSRVLHRQKRFAVVLPEEGVAARGDRPVLFFLHGRGGNERTAIDDPLMRMELLKARFVTVLPDGDESWYIDSPVCPAEKYASYLEEVLAVAERSYGLSRRQELRAIGGWSMGGYGCVRFAQTHPGQFAVVTPIIALLNYPAVGASYPVAANVFGDDPAVWRQFNPITQAERLRGMSILLMAADHGFERSMNESFRKRLDDLQIAHRWVLLPGTHHVDMVRQAMPMVVGQVQKAFDKRKSPF